MCPSDDSSTDGSDRAPGSSLPPATQPVAPTLIDPDSPRSSDDSTSSRIDRITSHEIIGPVGDGGMGVVYRARSVERDQIVALKTLRRMDDKAFRRLKQEFRTVADIAHENLIALYELLMEDGVPFLTMELIQGTDFLSYVRGQPASFTRTDALAPPDPERIDRIRSAARQLARGLSALHAAGKLHRDIKPSNVMVTRDGRVVLLDFGLALDSAHDEGMKVAGTPNYMAPEQAAGASLTPAVDWYAVGVIIYRALTDELPPGRSLSDMAQGRPLTPARPSERVPLVPRDLDDLCFELLQNAPEDRPSGDEVLARLGVDRAMGRPRPSHPRFVGRRRELDLLDDALTDALVGRAVVALITGPPGVGKTELVNQWIHRLGDTGSPLPDGVEPVVLRSRCRERETFPFKVFDGFVEGILEQLNALKRDREALSLAETEALGRLFPLLHDLGPTTGSDDEADAIRLRRRGVRALGNLLSHIARTRPLLVFVDDLQWSDSDSATLLGELFAAPAPAPMLFVATTRPEEEHTGHVGTRVLRDLDGLEVRDIELDALSNDQASALARHCASQIDPQRRRLSDHELEALAHESLGNPLFIEQLVFHAATSPAGEPRGASSLRAVISERVALLPEPARLLLEVVAVAGAPIPQLVAIDAAPTARSAWSAVGTLRVESLVRTDGARGVDVVEPWHDRIRECVTAELSKEVVAERHGQLARALERHAASGGAVEPAQLAVHHHGAGDLDRAAPYAIAAAERARAALAFDRAAELYELAIECDGGARLDLVHRRADALVDGGRCAEAAPLYLEVAAQSDEETALELRGLAAQQLMVSGRVDEGIAVLRPVLEDLGLKFPESTAGTLASIALQMVKLRLRGLDFTPRAPDRIERALSRQIDVCWGAGKGLLSFDSLRATHFHLRMLSLSLRAGEPMRASRALAIYGMLMVFDGSRRGHRWGLDALDRAERAAPTDDRYLEGVIAICRGTAEMSIGAFRRGLELLDRGIGILEGGCANVQWECAAARSSVFNTLWWLGDIDEIRKTAPPWIREGQQLGDLFTVVTAELYDAVARLADDDPKEASRRADAAITKWAQQGFHYQHWLAHKIQVWCALYRDDTAEAQRRVDAVAPTLTRSGLLGVELMQLDAAMLTGRVAVASAQHAGLFGRRRALGVVDRAIRKLDRIDRPAAKAGAALLRGQIEQVRHRASGRRQLDEAVRGFDRAQTRMHGLAVRRLLAEMGHGELAPIDNALRAAGVACPERWISLYVSR